MNVIEASGLGKRYGSTQALRVRTLAIPAGHVIALVGPNGSGKTTLLSLAVGLSAPSEGGLTVLGGRAPGSLAALDGIAFVAQDTPLYKNLSVVDMLHLTRNLNRHFDWAYALTRLGELGIPLKRKAAKLSGGQQAQLALTLALARHPRLLVLDEPMAMLDPLARHDFMAVVDDRDGRRRRIGGAFFARARRTRRGWPTTSSALSGGGTGSRRDRGPARLPPPAHRPRCRSREVFRTPERRALVAWAEPRHICSSGRTGQTPRCNQAGRRIRSAWKNSPLPTCASPAPRRCPVPPAAERPNIRK